MSAPSQRTNVVQPTLADAADHPLAASTIVAQRYLLADLSTFQFLAVAVAGMPVDKHQPHWPSVPACLKHIHRCLTAYTLALADRDPAASYARFTRDLPIARPQL